MEGQKEKGEKFPLFTFQAPFLSLRFAEIYRDGFAVIIPSFTVRIIIAIIKFHISRNIIIIKPSCHGEKALPISGITITIQLL